MQGPAAAGGDHWPWENKVQLNGLELMKGAESGYVFHVR